MAKPSKQERESPATLSIAAKTMAPRHYMINSLLGGTETMRESGEEFLPQHHREYHEDYQERLNCSVLFNVFELTLNSLAGKPFTEPLVLEEDVPEIIRSEYAEDIDLQGNHIDQFAGMVFREGIAKGLTHILVDTPARGPDVRTLRDERDAGVRPYMVHVPPENILAANSVRVNGVETLTHVRIYEAEMVRDGFAETLAEYIRVFDLGVTEDGELQVIATRYAKAEAKSRNGSDQWVIETSEPTDHKSIPLHTFYAERSGFMTAKPPLLDLAFLNVQHWQSSSDQFNILKVSRFPILAASGVDSDAQETTLGPRNVLQLDDPSARYYYVEHTGQAIEAGRKSLDDLVTHMSLYGATLLRRRPDRETATSRAIEERNNNAPLQNMALAFKDTLENALKSMAEMIGEEDGGSVTIFTDFAFDGGEVVDLQTLQVAYKDFALSKTGLLRELKRRKVLADDFDIEADEAELLSEIDRGIGAILSKKSRPGEDQGEPDDQDDLDESQDDLDENQD